MYVVVMHRKIIVEHVILIQKMIVPRTVVVNLVVMRLKMNVEHVVVLVFQRVYVIVI